MAAGCAILLAGVTISSATILSLDMGSGPVQSGFSAFNTTPSQTFGAITVTETGADGLYDRAIGGSSSGAVCAFTAAWERPDGFSRVFSAIGTYVGLRGANVYPTLVRKYEPKPLRIFTHVAENDLRAGDPEETYHNWVMANQRTAAALKAKGYDYRYVFSKASRHCDARVFEHTLADTLVWMWRGYEAE